jgi:hypothetical protein
MNLPVFPVVVVVHCMKTCPVGCWACVVFLSHDHIVVLLGCSLFGLSDNSAFLGMLAVGRI